MVLKVPPGTMVYDRESGELLADLAAEDSRAVIAKGGIGGRGNAHFATSVQQAPKFAENGEPGEHHLLRLELKLLADVGLLGYPSVGKSTLIAAVSAARPKIADYPFTTLIPNLGVVSVEPQKYFVMADLPGLIEGAHEGVGLGHQFLRHVERTRVLVHMLDVSGMTGRDPLDDFRVINRELGLYSSALSNIPQTVALNKIDVASDPELISRVESALKAEGHTVFRISAATHKGLKPLLYNLWNRLEESRNRPSESPDEELVKIKAPRETDSRYWEARLLEPGEWVVEGKGFERLVAMTNMDNDFALRRFQRTLEKSGVHRKLREMGAKEGDNVRIGSVEFTYEDEDLEQENHPFARRR
jgi:GTP-binding protein